MGWAAVPSILLRSSVFDNLQYYKGNENRHVFVNAMEIFHTHKMLVNVPSLTLTLGPRVAKNPPHVVVPYFNDASSFRPAEIRARPKSWWTDKARRTYSLCYFFSAVNPTMKRGPRIYRVYFIEEVQRSWNATPDLGGLPYIIEDMAGITNNHLAEVREIFPKVYERSLFCLVLPGDSPPQKRFFDVIMKGCIPVVLSFGDTSTGNVTTSWYSPQSYGIADSFPWAKGSNSTYPHLEIDYRSFVVEVPVPSEGDVSMVKPVLEGIMRNASEVRRRQLAMREVALAFSYGLGEDAEGGEREDTSSLDAFDRILESLRFYLLRLL